MDPINRLVFNNSKKNAFGLIALVAIIWFASRLTLPLETFWSGDTGVKLIQVESIISKKFRNFSLDYPGQEIDPELKYYPLSGRETAVLVFEANGKIYSKDQPFFAILTAAFYIFLGYYGLYIIPFLSGILTLYMTFLICRRSPVKDYSLPSILLMGLGTPLWFYSLTFWEHTLAAFFFSTALLCILIGREKGPPAIFGLCGIIFSLGASIRPEIYLLAVASTAALILDSEDWATCLKRISWIGIGLVAGLLPMWILNLLISGKLFGFHIDQFEHNSVENIVNSMTYTLSMLFRGPSASHFTDFLWQSPFFFIIFLSGAAWYKTKPELFCGALYLCIFISLMNLIKTERSLSGLFTISPFLVFLWILIAGPLDYIRQWLFKSRTNHMSNIFTVEEKKWVRFLGTILVVYLFLVAVSAPSPGGNQYGPRYLLPLYSILVLLTVFVMMKFLEADYASPFKKLLTVSFTLLFGLSVMFQIKGVSLLNEKKKAGVSVANASQQFTSEVFVTDAINYPWEVASLFYEKKMFLVKDGKDLEDLAFLLMKKNIREFVFVSRLINSKSALPDFTTFEKVKITSRPSDAIYISDSALLGDFVLLKCQIIINPT